MTPPFILTCSDKYWANCSASFHCTTIVALFCLYSKSEYTLESISVCVRPSVRLHGNRQAQSQISMKFSAQFHLNKISVEFEIVEWNPIYYTPCEREFYELQNDIPSINIWTPFLGSEDGWLTLIRVEESEFEVRFSKILTDLFLL